MYEHPQYLTPDGYRRGGAKKDTRKSRKASIHTWPDSTVSPKARQLQAQRGTPRRGISEEAAKLIANTIKIMLNSK